jgi:hypothetical protein
MKSFGLRVTAAAMLFGLAAASNIHSADASLGFCRTDPRVVFVTPDNSTHVLTLGANIATSRKNVSEVDWTINLPAGSRVVKVAHGGPIEENVSVSTADAAGTVDATATAVSSDSVEVDLSGRDLVNPGSTSTTATGTTNQPIPLQINL